MLLAITEQLGFLEEFFSEVVYPVWPAFLAGAIAGAVLAGFIGYRLGLHEVAMRHRFLTAGILAVVLVVSIPVGWYTISPLFDRETVCEASPIPGAGSGSEKCDNVALAATGSPTATAAPGQATPAPTDAPAATDAPALEPRVTQMGEFHGADDFHFGEGKALLIETEPGKYVLRFEEFSVRNGPDLFVYISPNPDGYDATAINLGELKGTDGAFNYDVPEGTDVSQVKSAIIWCKQFGTLFAVAPFEPGS